MMENIFILPGNEQELFNRYLDNNEYGPLKERLELVRKALSNKLSPDERNKHGLTWVCMNCPWNVRNWKERYSKWHSNPLQNGFVTSNALLANRGSGRHRAAKRRNISPPLRFRTL